MKWSSYKQRSCKATDAHRPVAHPLRSLAALAACLVLSGLAAELLSSCIRRPLEVYYFDKARLILHVDWMSHFGQRPNGMTVCIYDEGGLLYESRSMNEIDSVQLQLPVGRYRVIVFNEDVDAFASFGFQDIGSFDHFRTVARPNNSRRMTPTSWDYGTRYTW